MKKPWSAFVAALTTTVLCGCALTHSASEAKSPFPIEIVPTSPASIASARVVQEGSDVVISGTVRKFHEFHLPGKVLVVACGQDAVPLAEGQAHITDYASKRGGVKEARFTVPIEMVPPPETTFRLRYESPGAPDEGLNCR